MIAIAEPQPQYDHEAVNKQYEQMLPRIRLMALHAFRDRNYELRHELTNLFCNVRFAWLDIGSVVNDRVAHKKKSLGIHLHPPI